MQLSCCQSVKTTWHLAIGLSISSSKPDAINFFWRCKRTRRFVIGVIFQCNFLMVSSVSGWWIMIHAKRAPHPLPIPGAYCLSFINLFTTASSCDRLKVLQVAQAFRIGKKVFISVKQGKKNIWVQSDFYRILYIWGSGVPFGYYCQLLVGLKSNKSSSSFGG